ncbi:MAG: hypothetical protein OEV08_10110 [Nitrospira sp.]|nr:hypothetical protein [Nitrospira sp.]
MLTDGIEVFTTGLCRYQDDLSGQSSNNSKLFIEVKVGDLDFAVWAMVDTGAPYCIFEPEIPNELGYLFQPNNPTTLSTRFGPIIGTLHRIDLTLLANSGQSLVVSSTCLVPQALPSEWKGNFIGYVGCLQRFRFAVDPSNNTFHFGKHP